MILAAKCSLNGLKSLPSPSWLRKGASPHESVLQHLLQFSLESYRQGLLRPFKLTVETAPFKLRWMDWNFVFTWAFIRGEVISYWFGFLFVSSPTGLFNDPQLPIHALTFSYAGSIPLAGQHLRGVHEVGDEEAPSPSSSRFRATCARQGIGKGRAVGCSHNQSIFSVTQLIVPKLPGNTVILHVCGCSDWSVEGKYLSFI